jgi:hypothetical protein
MPRRTDRLSFATIPYLRLHNQMISGSALETPAETVAWLGAVQAQDYLAALWAVGLRTPGATERSVEQALADGSIIRTWPMRGTIHFIAAADARWMLELLTPRVLARQAGRLKKEFDIDETVSARCATILGDALRGGGRLTRNDAYHLLEANGVAASGQRGLHILWRLAHERIICFGPREGKQPTVVLFDEWIPDGEPLERDEALSRLATRYFTSHGPATLHDFIWWSGLTAADARAAVERAHEHLRREDIDGQRYWLSSSAPERIRRDPGLHLLPAFDEYTVAYRDRSAVLGPVTKGEIVSTNGIFNPIIVIDGQVVGTWKRRLEKESVVVMPNPFRELTKAERKSLATAADRYGTFLGLAAEVESGTTGR